MLPSLPGKLLAFHQLSDLQNILCEDIVKHRLRLREHGWNHLPQTNFVALAPRPHRFVAANAVHEAGKTGGTTGSPGQLDGRGDCGVLELTPWRIELWSLEEMIQQQPQRVWRQEV